MQHDVVLFFMCTVLYIKFMVVHNIISVTVLTVINENI